MDAGYWQSSICPFSFFLKKREQKRGKTKTNVGNPERARLIDRFEFATLQVAYTEKCRTKDSDGEA